MRLFRKILAFRSVRGTGRAGQSRRVALECRPLEGRQLLSAGMNATVRHETAQLNRAFHHFVADLHAAAAGSQVTKAEAGALIEDEAQALKSLTFQVASNGPNLPATPQQTAIDQTLSYLNGDVGLTLFTGWQTDAAWAQSSSRQVLRQDLASAGLSPSQTDQFVADARAFAQAGGISPQSFTTLSSDMTAYNTAASALVASGRTPSVATNPMTYLIDHLTLFVRQR